MGKMPLCLMIFAFIDFIGNDVQIVTDDDILLIKR